MSENSQTNCLFTVSVKQTAEQLALIVFKQQKNMIKCNRMLEAGEDPLYVAIRITRFTSEDVGLAAPYALEIAVCRLRLLLQHKVSQNNQSICNK